MEEAHRRGIKVILDGVFNHCGSFNRWLDRERIYEQIWGYDAEGSADVIKEHIRKIRAKFYEATGENYIETVWGVGYKWTR